MQTHTLCLAILALSCVEAHAQNANPPPAVDGSYTATATTYVVPDSRNYVEGVFTADRRWLHLEGRYNYENLETGSAWVGYNFNLGSKVRLDVTAMVGAVFGRTTGIAPGERLTFNWRRFELYSEAEYVFSTDTRADSFFYSWSELSLSPYHWLRMGLAGQRTQAYQSEHKLQRGFLLGFEHKRMGITAYVLNPDRRAVYIVSAQVEF